MKTYKLYRKNGRFFAFEIENAYIRPRKIAKLLGAIACVTDIKVRKLFGSPIDTHVQFKYQDKDFIVWEPFGDSSRYWIGPENENDVIDITTLECVFEKYRPPILFKMFGDLITLNFRSLFKALRKN